MISVDMHLNSAEPKFRLSRKRICKYTNKPYHALSMKVNGHTDNITIFLTSEQALKLASTIYAKLLMEEANYVVCCRNDNERNDC